MSNGMVFDAEPVLTDSVTVAPRFGVAARGRVLAHDGVDRAAVLGDRRGRDLEVVRLRGRRWRRRPSSSPRSVRETVAWSSPSFDRREEDRADDGREAEDREHPDERGVPALARDRRDRRRRRPRSSTRGVATVDAP